MIFSSDQGFFLGEHGWFDKRWIFEESLRTPLLVRWPGVTKPGSVNQPHRVAVGFCPDVSGHRRRALRPPTCKAAAWCRCCKGETPADWRKSLYYHYYEFPVPHRVRPHYGVITDRFKLVHYYKPDVDDWELLGPREGSTRGQELLQRPGLCCDRKGATRRVRPAAQGSRRDPASRLAQPTATSRSPASEKIGRLRLTPEEDKSTGTSLKNRLGSTRPREPARRKLRDPNRLP